MGSGNSKLEEIETISKSFKQTIKDLRDGVESLSGFDFIQDTIDQLSSESAEFSDEEYKAFQCMFESKKKISIAVNDAKNVVSDVKALCITLNSVINDETGSNDQKVHLAIKTFKLSMNDLLPKLEHARDGLSEVTRDLESLASEITRLETWCSGKKQKLENEKKLCVAKKRGVAYGGAAGVTAAAAGTVAVFCWWNPIALLAAKVAAGAAASSTVSFSVAAGVVEGATIPQLKEIYDKGIKGMKESVKKFQEMSEKNKERTKSLNVQVEQLRGIVSAAHQTKISASIALGFDEDDIMFNTLKRNVKELERLSETYLKVKFLS